MGLTRRVLPKSIFQFAFKQNISNNVRVTFLGVNKKKVKRLPGTRFLFKNRYKRKIFKRILRLNQKLMNYSHYFFNSFGWLIQKRQYLYFRYKYNGFKMFWRIARGSTEFMKFKKLAIFSTFSESNFYRTQRFFLKLRLVHALFLLGLNKLKHTVVDYSWWKRIKILLNIKLKFRKKLGQKIPSCENFRGRYSAFQKTSFRVTKKKHSPDLKPKLKGRDNVSGLHGLTGSFFSKHPKFRGDIKGLLNRGNKIQPNQTNIETSRCKRLHFKIHYIKSKFFFRLTKIIKKHKFLYCGTRFGKMRCFNFMFSTMCKRLRYMLPTRVSFLEKASLSKEIREFSNMKYWVLNKKLKRSTFGHVKFNFFHDRLNFLGYYIPQKYNQGLVLINFFIFFKKVLKCPTQTFRLITKREFSLLEKTRMLNNLYVYSGGIKNRLMRRRKNKKTLFKKFRFFRRSFNFKKSKLAKEARIFYLKLLSKKKMSNFIMNFFFLIKRKRKFIESARFFDYAQRYYIRKFGYISKFKQSLKFFKVLNQNLFASKRFVIPRSAQLSLVRNRHQNWASKKVIKNKIAKFPKKLLSKNKFNVNYNRFKVLKFQSSLRTIKKCRSVPFKKIYRFRLFSPSRPTKLSQFFSVNKKKWLNLLSDRFNNRNRRVYFSTRRYKYLGKRARRRVKRRSFTKIKRVVSGNKTLFSKRFLQFIRRRFNFKILTKRKKRRKKQKKIEPEFYPFAFWLTPQTNVKFKRKKRRDPFNDFHAIYRHFYYGLSPRKLWKITKMLSKKLKGGFKENYVRALEFRLDFLLFRLKFSNSVQSSLHIISSSFIFINGKSCLSPFYVISEKDIISLNPLNRYNFSIKFLTKIERLLYKSPVTNQIPKFFEFNFEYFSFVYLKSLFDIGLLNFFPFRRRRKFRFYSTLMSWGKHELRRIKNRVKRRN